MTISSFWVYIWGIADNLGRFFMAGAVIAGIIAFFSAFFGEDPSWKRLFKWAISIVAVSGLLATLMPSSKTVALMYVVPALVNSEVIQKDAPELYHDAMELLKLKMKTYTEELKTPKK